MNSAIESPVRGSSGIGYGVANVGATGPDAIPGMAPGPTFLVLLKGRCREACPPTAPETVAARDTLSVRNQVIEALQIVDDTPYPATAAFAIL